jgi:hypothetical protein
MGTVVLLGSYVVPALGVLLVVAGFAFPLLDG